MANEEIHIGNLLVTEHDRYGKSLPVYFRIPPSVSYRVYNLLYSEVFPFQTKEELSRWAFCLGILSLEKVERFDYSSPLLNLPLVIYGTYGPVDKYRFFIEVERIVGDLSALGYRTPALQKFIATIEELIECLPSKYDREEYSSMLKLRQRGLLNAADWPAHPSRKGYRGR
jgi:hypothetical protein